MNSLQRGLSFIKYHHAGSLGAGEVCRAAVCVELATSVCFAGQQLSRKDFVRCSCATAKTYQASYNALQKMLAVQPRVELRELVVQYGCFK